MKHFLQELAEIYVQNHCDELDGITFVFPGKRAGTFFMQHLQQCLNERHIDKAVLMPRITTISEITEQLSGKVIDSRIDMLFLLYKEYCKLQPQGVTVPDFDRFRSWGDTILSDFNDVDMYLADAEKLFANLANYKEIQTDYLTEEQKRVLEQYFGPSFSSSHTERFWQHFQPENSPKESKKKFLRIWETLYPLYKAFNKRLEDEGMCYAGAAYRNALKRLQMTENIPHLLQCQRIVFVGFNVLSTAEFSIFAILRDTETEDGKRFADFYWDCTGPAMADKQNSAVKFISVNKKVFPSQYKLTESNTDSFPRQLDVIGCPSNSIQAKQIHDLLVDMSDGDEAEQKAVKQALDTAKAAVVLPDESLLMPVIYALPQNIDRCNITMGYPLKMTSIASFLSLVRRMQCRRRVSRGSISFFYDDVTAVLQHPMAAILFPPDVVSKFIDYAIKHRMFLIGVDFLAEAFGEYSILFEAADNKNLLQNREQCSLHYPTTIYVHTLMSELCTNIADGTEKSESVLLRSKLDYDHALIYIEAINQLDDTLHCREIETSMSQIFRLIDRLLATEHVTIQGKPLTGLQIMGMLETRGIDFDYVIIPSMNEKIFPRKAQKRSFIPNTLRIGYGLATTRFEESIFAYNFYRLISRAKCVHMLYDTRTGGLRSGDVSRYILQLQYVYGLDPSKITQISFDPIDTKTTPLVIPKTEKVLEALNRFLNDDLDDKGKALSATSLKHYLSCPLKFYLSDIRRLRAEDKLDEFISPIDQGDIFHKTMEDIYTRITSELKPNRQGHCLIPYETLDRWVSHRSGDIIQIIDNRVRIYLDEQYKPGSSGKEFIGEDIKMYYRALKRFVDITLHADLLLAKEHGCLIYHNSELNEKVKYPLPDGRTVNMKYIIDRLDELGSENPLLRISDYKTGADNPDIDKLENVFANRDDQAVFQLMLYANLYALKHGHAGPIRLDLYCTRDMHIRQFKTTVQCEGKQISDYRTLNDRFIEILNSVLSELFDPEIPFSQTSNSKTCEYCEFKQLCSQVK